MDSLFASLNRIIENEVRTSALVRRDPELRGARADADLCGDEEVVAMLHADADAMARSHLHPLIHIYTPLIHSFTPSFTSAPPHSQKLNPTRPTCVMRCNVLAYAYPCLAMPRVVQGLRKFFASFSSQSNGEKLALIIFAASRSETAPRFPLPSCV